jgi:uncharacterized protein (TIGR02453 family)
MTFNGWPAEAVTFFEGLEADNSKAYWLAHRELYEQSVRGPMEALLGELAGTYGQGKVFRPYRDVRFSADKSPYKLECAAHLPHGYLALSADGLLFGCGLYRPDPSQLDRYRRAVADDRSGPALESIAASLRAQGYDVGGHEELRSAPRGYPRDHPRIALLRQKGILMGCRWPPGPWLATGKAKDRVVAALEAARPLRDWIAGHTG